MEEVRRETWAVEIRNERMGRIAIDEALQKYAEEDIKK